MPPAIEVKHLWKVFHLSHRANSFKRAALDLFRRQTTYEEMVALRDLTFTVGAGETVAVIGRNGSGKSTLLALLGRVYRPTRGQCLVRGRVAILLELGAGFHPELTGVENIYLNGAILGMRRREVEEKLEQIVAFSELEHFIDTSVKTYSSGMLMRLGFAIAVHVDPDVLLVDEVLAVGDQAFQQKCYRQIEAFQAAGKTILFVSHDLEAVRRVAQRAIWLDHGHLRADGPVEATLGRYLDAVVAGPQESNGHGSWLTVNG